MPNSEFEKQLAAAEKSAAFETQLAAAETAVAEPNTVSEELPFSTSFIRSTVDSALGFPQGLFEMQKKMSGLGEPREGEPFGANELQAIFQSVPGLFGKQLIGDRFQDELAGIEENVASVEEEHPFLTGAGDIAGDITALGFGRAGLTNPITKFENLIMTKGLGKWFSNPHNITSAGLHKIVESTKMRSFIKSLFRIGEAGAEGAILDLMKGDSPGMTAVYAAGAQSVTGIGAGIHKGLTSGKLTQKGTKFAATAAITFAAWQAWKNLVPGGDDGTGLSATIDQSESIDFALDKTMMIYAFGIASTLAGGGRMRSGEKGTFTGASPRVLDVVNSIPRTAITSMFQRMIDAKPEEQAGLLEQLQQAIEDPEMAEKLFSGN